MTKSPSPSVDEVAEAATELLALLDDFMVVTSITANDRYSQAVERLRASLVSPPKAGSGEPFAWHWMAKDKMSTWPAWSLGAERPEFAPVDAIPLYANHEARGDGVRATDAEALHGAIISRVMPFTRDDMTNEQAASLGEDLMGMIQRAALPPLGDDATPGQMDAARRAANASSAAEASEIARSALLPPLGDGRAEIVEAQAFPKTLSLIHQAIDGYVSALVAREHGGVAENRAFAAICEALGRSPAQEMDARRHPLSSPGGGLS